MTSRDEYNRNRKPLGPQDSPEGSSASPQNWGLDAGELKRYMSGVRPQDPDVDPYAGASRAPERRAPQPSPPSPAHYRPQSRQYDADDWVEDDYPIEQGYGSTRPQPVSRRSVSRYEPEPYDDYQDDLYDDPYAQEDDEFVPPPRRRQAPRQRPQREPVNLTLPPFIKEAPLVRDRTALTLAGAAMASLAIMIIFVAVRRDGLGDTIYTHVNALGNPDVEESSSAIWRLPLMAAMMTLMSASLAWFVAKWQNFLPRFLLGGSIGVQFVVWVAVIAFLR